MLNLEKIYQSSYPNNNYNKIPVLMYHRFINDKSMIGKSRIHINIKNIEKHFNFLKTQGFITITFTDLLDDSLISKLEQGYKFVIITVDDGYLDNYELLFPLLKKYKFKAVIYVVTGVSYNKWDVDSIQETKFPLMNSLQLKAMVASGLVEIGGHTLTHPNLTQLTVEEQLEEIKLNKQQLETITGSDIISFAYPYGDFNKDTKIIVKQSGYLFAVATNNVSNTFDEDLYQIKRIPICRWDNSLTIRFKIMKYY